MFIEQAPDVGFQMGSIQKKSRKGRYTASKEPSNGIPDTVLVDLHWRPYIPGALNIAFFQVRPQK